MPFNDPQMQFLSDHNFEGPCMFDVWRNFGSVHLKAGDRTVEWAETEDVPYPGSLE